MSRFSVLVGALALGLAGLLGAQSASAGCYCTCSQGRMVPACSGSFDIPPICPATVCVAPSARQAPPMVSPGLHSACKNNQICDAFGRCKPAPNC